MPLKLEAIFQKGIGELMKAVEMKKELTKIFPGWIDSFAKASKKIAIAAKTHSFGERRDEDVANIFKQTMLRELCNWRVFRNGSLPSL